jgi:hypothetical protein
MNARFDIESFVVDYIVQKDGQDNAASATVDHHSLDDEFWSRMTAHYSQREIVELSMCIGSWLAFGRLNHVLGLDAICVLPNH